ncbi:hypothetical protein Xph01_18730 [Micromonospora phaseoli]|nr:hypothetical protein Xph01_18730 [Micromonospora phaseoli]
MEQPYAGTPTVRGDYVQHVIGFDIRIVWFFSPRYAFSVGRSRRPTGPVAGRTRPRRPRHRGSQHPACLVCAPAVVALKAQTGRRERPCVVTRTRSGTFILPWRTPRDRHPATAAPIVPFRTSRPLARSAGTAAGIGRGPGGTGPASCHPPFSS